jgi:tetratricopeptide (TPR) repeat protein
MKKYLFFLAIFIFVSQSFAQVPYNSALPNGYTKKAVVSEQIGLIQVAVTYHRPAVNGREGKVWGELVHKGFIKQGFGPDNPAPWRAGANENTIIEFENDVKIEGQNLAKGKYGLFIAYDAAESIIIFSRKTDAWGSFFYDEKEDVLRVKVKPQPLEKSVEWLRYEFANQTQNSATISLEWEKLSIPFKVEVDALKQQFDIFAAEAKNPRGFTSEGLNIAANWSLTNNYQLEKGLEWIDFAISTFNGDQKFPILATKAQLLEKMGKPTESAVIMKQAVPIGNMNDLHQYGRQLLALKKPKEALEVFQMNYDKNPNQFTTLMGMTRGLSANGNYPKALEFAFKALPLAPNDVNKKAIEAMIVKLKESKDIN